MLQRSEGGATPRLLAAIVAAQLLGLISLELAPLVVSALIDHLALSETAAGGLASVELCALAVAMLASASTMARRSRARFAMAGACIAIAGHVASTFTSDYALLMLTRALAGVGAGIVFAAGSAAAAGAREPDRLFAIAAFSGGLCGAVLLAGMPYATVPYGPSGAFAIMAVLAIAIFPALRWLPAPAIQQPGDGSGALPHRALGMLALVSLAFLALGEGAVWAFAAKMAVGAGLSVAGAGGVLAVTSLVGLAGSATAAWIGTRLGRVVPVCVGLVVLVVAVVVLVHAHDPVVFTLAACVWGLSFFFIFPFLMGTMAVLDTRGRWAVAGGAAELIGLGLGPVVGGVLVTGGNYSVLSEYMVAAGLIALVFVFPVLRFADAKSRSDKASATSASSLRGDST